MSPDKLLIRSLPGHCDQLRPRSIICETDLKQIERESGPILFSKLAEYGAVKPKE